MRHVHLIMRLSIGSLLALLLLFVGFSSQAFAHEFTDVGLHDPAKAYLALGDSLAFGYQGYKDGRLQTPPQPFNPDAFTTGYDTNFLAKLQQIQPKIREVNFSCPGETTSTFINGGCLFHNVDNPLPLHNNYPVEVSQLQVALAFLYKHHDQVSPITFNLGSNDENVLVDGCVRQADPAGCIHQGFPPILQTAKTNLAFILNDLRMAAPKSKILVLQTPQAMQLIPGVQDLADQMNAAIQETAQAIDATIVDAHSGFTQENLCQFSLYCVSNGADFHPSDAGYVYIAEQLWNASGY